MTSFTMPVEHYMSAPVRTIAAAADLREAHQRLRVLDISSLGVIDESGAQVGVVSRTDLLRVGRYQTETPGEAVLLKLPHAPVSDIMTRDVVAVSRTDSVALACKHMVRKHIHRVFVNDEAGLCGIFSSRDVMRAIRESRMENLISDFMSTPLFTIRSNESIALATERLAKAHVTGLVVVEDDWPVGVFTQIEALRVRTMPKETPVEEVMNAAMVCMPTDTRMFRAAEQATAMRVRRIIACHRREMVGILTGIDFARATA